MEHLNCGFELMWDKSEDYGKKEVIFKVLVLANLRQNGGLTINDIFKDRNFN